MTHLGSHYMTSGAKSSRRHTGMRGAVNDALKSVDVTPANNETRSRDPPPTQTSEQFQSAQSKLLLCANRSQHKSSGTNLRAPVQIEYDFKTKDNSNNNVTIRITVYLKCKW